MTTLDPRHAAILMAHVRAETAFDMAGTLATLTPDCLFEDMATGERFVGHDAVRGYYASWWSAFGNVPERSRSHVPSPDLMIAETRFVGVHRGPWEGLAATGRSIDLPIAIVVSFRDGLMSGERFYYDRSTLRTQIGR